MFGKKRKDEPKQFTMLPPQPGQPAPQIVYVQAPPQKKGGGCMAAIGKMVVGGAVLLVLLVALVYAGAQGGSDEPDRVVVGPRGPIQNAPDAPELGSGEKPAAVGQTVVADCLAMTVVGHRTEEKIGLLGADEPGYRYLVLEVQATNACTDGEVAYNTLYWSGTDPDSGLKFDDALMVDVPQPLGSGNLSANNKARGLVVLKVASATRTVRVKYDTSPIGGTNLYWNVPV